MDEIITFNHLTKANFVGIADIMLRQLQHGLSERGLTLTWDDAVVDYLVEKAFSVTYGARNLRRTIQKELEDPIAERIIDSFESPISEIAVSCQNSQLAIDAK